MIKCQFISALSKEKFLSNWKMWACLMSQFGFIDGFYFPSEMNLIFPKGWKMMYWKSLRVGGLNLELDCTPTLCWGPVTSQTPRRFYFGDDSNVFNPGKHYIFLRTINCHIFCGRRPWSKIIHVNLPADKHKVLYFQSANCSTQQCLWSKYCHEELSLRYFYANLIFRDLLSFVWSKS